MLAAVQAEAERQRMAEELEDAREKLMSATKRADALGASGIHVHLLLSLASVDDARERLTEETPDFQPEESGRRVADTTGALTPTRR